MISRNWKRVEGFDLDFRPRSYWPLGEAIRLAPTAKGTFRRALLAELEEDLPPGVADVIARESLSDSLRRAFAAIHPLRMSGEFLPDLDEDEVEIARFTLASAMGDAIELRARRTARGIRYRMVDENETEYTIRRRYAREPLTMFELIRAIEGAKPENPTVDVLRDNLEALDEEDRDSMSGFVEVTSPFCPELGAWYARYLELWFEDFRRHARRSEHSLE